MSRNATGFTLIELMVTIAVAAILLTVAVPGFQSLVQNNRATTAANQLSTAFNFARSEAVTRGVEVSVCPVDAGGDWHPDGWRVVLGNDCAPAEMANPLRRWEDISGRVVIDDNIEDQSHVTFGPLGGRESPGRDDQSDPMFYVYAENCSGERARDLNIGPGGKVGIVRSDCP
ncbi:GspH/FimT family pseudopilin [Thioalkalivibrio sp. ALE20]|uniref:GspH/FimT family pseudopilin n=1 Tax=Thioalkalivibrio sp. ALE20 TaxID=545275 RepID=UPI0003622F2D|nr:GspH/FimT family pseudopilin [Thioalkalivibrio sp. ALE20]